MQGYPFVEPGLTIGLLGGSFDPPHEGHVHITKLALKIFKLSKIWWLVCPENPLKGVIPLDLNSRIIASKKIMRHPSVVITDIEKKFKTKYTFQTLIRLKILYPKTKFVWLMGADNLVNFHNWKNWDWIMKNIPVGVLARPEEQIKAGLSLTATKFKNYRLPKDKSILLSNYCPPAWTLISGPMRNISSTEIRKKGYHHS